MQRVDRWLGLVLALLGGAVFVSSSAFPSVPGQKVGAGFLPAIVGVGLLAAGLALMLRSLRASAYAGGARAPDGARQVAASFAVVAVTLAYILLSERLGFLIVTPFVLLALFAVFSVRFAPALLWALAGTAVVHVAFYKLLRVPLPWGVLRPFY